MTIEKLDARIGRGWRLGLDGMRRVLARMEPVAYPVILVGGTNGKGSVCRMLHDWFRHRGMRTGLTTSPHLVDVRERIVIDGEKISVPEFDALFEEIIALDDDKSTYFETLALMAIRAFQKACVDIAIVEIGLGGRLDAFNALDPAVSVITSVGLEHTQYLGETLEKIALEKAQIARAGRFCVLGERLPVLIEEVGRIGAETIIVESASERDFRARNIAIAGASAATYHAFRGEDFDVATFRRFAAESRWPCRFELVPGSPEMILDAAHNPPAAEALALAFATLEPRRRTVGLAAFVSDKDVAGFFVRLDAQVDHWIVTQFESERALMAEEAPAPFNAIREPDMAKALKAAIAAAGAHGRVLVTGSIYFLGELLKRKLITSPSLQ